MEADILQKKKDLYLVPELWRPIFLESKKDLYLVQSMEADILKKYCSLIYFIL